MACRHVMFHVKVKRDGPKLYSAECERCGVATLWCLTPEEASARMRAGGTWVTGPEDGKRHTEGVAK